MAFGICLDVLGPLFDENRGYRYPTPCLDGVFPVRGSDDVSPVVVHGVDVLREAHAIHQYVHLPSKSMDSMRPGKTPSSPKMQVLCSSYVIPLVLVSLDKSPHGNHEL